MLIHSVTPLHMLVEQPGIQAPASKMVDGGYVEGYDTPQGFLMTRLCSTNPSLYLENRYSPGSILREETH